MPQSLPLNISTWDVELDEYGNLSLGPEVESISQDVACAIRTFQGECRYNINLGMPYFQNILWKLPPGSLVTSFIQQQAATISLVDQCAVPSLLLGSNRQLSGLVVFNTSLSSTPSAVTF